MTPTTGVQAQKTVEQLILDKLEHVSSEVGQVRKDTTQTNANVTVMAVKLFGSKDSDDEHDSGRLPKVESSAKKAHERMDRIERRIVYWAGAVAAAAFALPLAMLLWTAWIQGGKH